MPCGKLAYPPKTEENQNARMERLYPILDMLETNRKMSIRQKIENRAEIRKTDEIARFRTATQFEERSMDLERRSDRLKRIMDDEMFTYTQQILNEFEQQKESKIEAMRERVAELRKKREDEEKKVVDAKLDQAFQTSCEQLRTLRVQKMAKEISKDWDEQIKMKERLSCEQEENDRMYAYLWIKDAENKFQREQAYECTRKEAMRRGLEELDRQMEYKRQQQGIQAKVREREIAENVKILKELEEEQKKLEEEKQVRYLRSKDHVKDMMATREYYRNRRIKREEIVALEFLKKAVRELYIEQEDRNKAKRELMRSIEIYREYLRQRDCLANTRDLELQQIIDNVIEEQYQKVNETRRREKAQRKQLFCNVMAGRAQQMEDLRTKRQEEDAQYKMEVAKLKEDWKLYLREVEAEKSGKAAKQGQYRRDLDCQVQYKNVRQERELKEFWREEELGEMQDTFFLNKLKTTLNEAQDVKSNPSRDPLVGKHIKQCLRPV
ncbi:unnamed protein product [Orchesella dallaii]|uniref:Cilia- and flagella-associated protein 53 n=1 Tax=Orchesella dallaii TaxID=48710 RepID=A0ABP1RXH6_9HEXA